jgi:peptidoglycan/xylan/chitin deacetylase (PgdA/CDA1 family)
MYHYLSVPPPDADVYRLDLSVRPEVFDAQMTYLAQQGYHPIHLSDLSGHLQTGAELPQKPIVVTFDDGYDDNYVNAFPILKDHGFTATFFVVTGFIGGGRNGYLSWEQIREMATNGMEIGSHSDTHPDLRRKSEAFLQTELAGSRATIEAHIQMPVTAFSYPAGKYDQRVMDALARAGFTSAVTEIQGVRQSAPQPFLLKRIRVRGAWSVEEFAYWLGYWENGRY